MGAWGCAAWLGESARVGIPPPPLGCVSGMHCLGSAIPHFFPWVVCLGCIAWGQQFHSSLFFVGAWGALPGVTPGMQFGELLAQGELGVKLLSDLFWLLFFIASFGADENL